VRAGAFYAELLQWRPELVRAGSGCYLAVDLGPAVGGGITECQTRRPLWLPYAEVERIDDATERARRLGGGAARTTGGAIGLAKCRVQPGRRGGGLVAAEAMTEDSPSTKREEPRCSPSSSAL
jgi:predicted enzyme related to lactoylglutathione lyase